jgi:hypothetical protein
MIVAVIEVAVTVLMIVIVRVRDAVEVIMRVAVVVFGVFSPLQDGRSVVALGFTPIEPLRKLSKHLAP